METHKITKIKPKIIKKGWGYESVIANDEYCGKLLVFTKKESIGSLHFHRLKKEHFMILSGFFQLYCVNPKNAEPFTLELKTGDVVEIPRGHVHQIICVEAGTIMEVSTPDSPEDSYRVGKGDTQK